MIDFSVLVPVLNEVEHVERCLDALAGQRIASDRFEILVIDNGSTDGTLEVLRRRPGITLLHEPRPDPYLARNRGIEAARGRIVAFTDGDCEPAPDWLDAFESAFDAGADIAIGRLAYPAGSSFWLDRYADYYDAKTRWIFEQAAHDGIYGHAGNMAVRAEVFETIGRFPPLPLAGDTELLHRARERLDAPALRYVEDAVVTHLEVATLRDLLPKLARYGAYSSAVRDAGRYRVLSLGEKLAVTFRCAREHRYGPLRLAGLGLTLTLGLASFEWGRRRAAPGSAAGAEAPR